jgi:heme/copper-type cytochrome/quinol oxidase subunit 1
LFGGDPVFYQHLFWLFGHPEVYILVLPAFGLISSVLSGIVQVILFGNISMILAMSCISALGSIVWAHHMFTIGLISDTRAYFMSVTMIISIPTGSKIFNWLCTYLGSNAIFNMISTSAVFFVPIFLIMFTIGGSTGIILGSAVVDIGLHDTYYVVTHFHFVLSLGTVIAIFIGLTYFQDSLLPTPSYLLLSNLSLTSSVSISTSVSTSSVIPIQFQVHYQSSIQSLIQSQVQSHIKLSEYLILVVIVIMNHIIHHIICSINHTINHIQNFSNFSDVQSFRQSSYNWFHHSLELSLHPITSSISRYYLIVNFVGITSTFIPMHFLGFNVMPRRIPDFPDYVNCWNYMSSLGSGITLISFLIASHIGSNIKLMTEPEPRDDVNSSNSRYPDIPSY